MIRRLLTLHISKIFCIALLSYGWTASLWAYQMGNHDLIDILELGDFYAAKVIIETQKEQDPLLYKHLTALRLFYEARYKEAQLILEDHFNGDKGNNNQNSTTPSLGLSSNQNLAIILRMKTLLKRLQQFSDLMEKGDQLSSRYFKVIFHHPKDRLLAQVIADQMDEILVRLGEAFEYPLHSFLQEKIRIEIYSTIESFSAATGVDVLSLNGSGTVAICKYNRVMVSSPRLYIYGYHIIRTVTHELVHFLAIKKSLNKWPLWLHEGMAKYFESYWQQGGASHPMSLTTSSILAKAIRDDALIPIEKMSPSFAYLKDGENVTAFAEVYSMVRLLIQQKGINSFNQLFYLVSRGAKFEEGFKDIYGQEFSTFLVSWEKWLRSQGFKVYDELPDLIPRTQNSLSPEKQAQKNIDEAQKEAPITAASKYKLIGNLMLDQARFRASEIEFAKAYKYAKENLSILKKLVFLSMKNGNLPRAERVIKEGKSLYPEDYFFDYWDGMWNLKKERWKKAKESFQLALFGNVFDLNTLNGLMAANQQLQLKKQSNEIKRHIELLNPPKSARGN